MNGLQPAVAVRRPSSPSADQPSPTALWVVIGQAALQTALFFGFGVVMLPAPLVVAGSTLVLAATTVLLAPHGHLGRIRVHLAPLVLVWWWSLSLLWTRDPAQWWIDTMANLPIVVATVVAGSILPVDRTVRALVSFVHLTIVFQIVWIATHPSEATVNRDLLTGAITPGWRGSFIHKNALGPYLVIALLTVLLLERRRALRWCTTIATLGLLGLSQSVTSWTVATVAVALSWWLGWFATTARRTRAAVVVPSVVLGGLGLAVLTRVYPTIVDAYGKDLTFTGRTVIWASALEAIERRPITGYGIGGVWFRPHDDPARAILAEVGFTVFHTHNGYLELLLLLGVVGLTLWLWLVSTTLVAAWRALELDHRVAAWAMTVTITVIVVSAAEVLVFGAWLALLIVARLIVDGHRRRHDEIAPEVR